ncbi:uncharacterized protein LOC136035114 isoform X2 [Artemia franciscana]|uniref:uncharacterized protein LOC136035114 isoform X2 n=1 Tax=Artemia franciscana TaxID=6661 RepID=UPI0032DA2AE7
MPSGSLKLTLDITIHKVECPGMHLSYGDKLLVRFCILNYHLRTSKINKGPAYAFNERFFLQKSLPLCFQPRHVIELLAGDKCVLELVAIRNVIPVTLARFPIDTISFIFEALQTIKTDEIVEKRMKLRLHKVRNEKLPLDPCVEVTVRSQLGATCGLDAEGLDHAVNLSSGQVGISVGSNIYLVFTNFE